LSELQWEDTVCDGCGSSQSDYLFEGPDRLLNLPGQFRMVRCQECGLIRQQPRLAWESLKNYYTEAYAPYTPLLREEPSVWRRLDKRYGMWKQLRLVERFQHGGRLLDIGCGTGHFLEEAKLSRRWEISGVEPNATAAAYARQALPANIIEGRFSDTTFQPNSFDVITMWNVLEHVSYPLADLRRARALLRDQGWLVFTVPNVDGLEARLFGPYWVGWDLPRHLYLFPRAQLRTLLNAIGFQLVDMRCFSSSYIFLKHNLEFWSQTWNPPYAAWRNSILQLYLSAPIRIGLSLPLWLLDRLKLTSVITIVARKQNIPKRDSSC